MKSVLAEKEKDKLKYEIYNVINEREKGKRNKKRSVRVPVLLRMMWMASA
jgi:hypothetical protein